MTWTRLPVCANASSVLHRLPATQSAPVTAGSRLLAFIEVAEQRDRE